MILARFGYDKPLWNGRRDHLLQFPDHKATEKENSGKTSEKQKKKKGPKIRLSQRSSTYIKMAKKNGSRLLPGRSILSIANSIPSVF